MSYEIIKSINERKRTITSACNNLRPLHYSKTQYNECMSVDEFRASVIISLVWGDYHYNNKTHIYNLVASKVTSSEDFKALEEKIWNWNNTYTKEWVKENYENNKNELKYLIINTFNELEKAPKELWVLSYDKFYIKRINKWTFSYTLDKEKALKFGSEEMALNSAKGLGNYWKPTKIAVE